MISNKIIETKEFSEFTMRVPLKLCGNIDGKRKRLIEISMAGVESVTVLKCQDHRRKYKEISLKSNSCNS